MAIDTTWTGAVSGAFDTAGNWTNGVPLNGESWALDGSVPITSDLDQSAKAFPLVVRRASYRGDIGNSRTDPLITGQITKYVHDGAGKTYLEAPIITAAVQGMRNQADALVHVGANGITTLGIGGGLGDIQLRSTGQYTSVSIGRGAEGVRVSDTTAGTIDYLVANAGRIELSGTIVETPVFGGACRAILNAAAILTAGLAVQDRALVDLLTENTFSAIYAQGGFVDGTANASESNVTISEIFSHPGSTVDLRNGNGTLIAADILDFGGRVLQG
jgi:hypothetical protein